MRVLTAILAALAFAVPAVSCPFCNATGTTLATEFSGADLIVLATVEEAIKDPDDISKNRSIIKVERVLKAHPAFDDPKTLTVQRYIPKVVGGKEPQWILFCYVTPEAIRKTAASVTSTLALADYSNAYVDAYRGDELPKGSQLPAYLEGTRKLAGKPQTERLAFFFEYLESNEIFVSSDAFTEWGFADYKDVRTVAANLKPETLLAWLRDPGTLGSRLGLYGLLLGHCGKKEHAAELRKLLDDPGNKYSLGLDGLLAGYTLLDPKAGWEYVAALARETKKDFNTRYAALRTLRFFEESRPDLTDATARRDLFRDILAQDDIADMVIEDFRRWKKWDEAATILEWSKKETHDKGIVKRAILKFCIAASWEAKNADAAAYVEKARTANPRAVKVAEDLVRDDAPKAGGK